MISFVNGRAQAWSLRMISRAATYGGASTLVVTAGAYDAVVTTSEQNEPVGVDGLIDRSAFDAYFGTDTAWTL